MADAPPNISKRARRAKDVTASTEKTVSRPGLRPWQPGQSGNPSGRPKRKPVTDLILATLPTEYRSGQTYGQALVAALFKIAFRGRDREAIEAARLLIAYSDGLATQSIQLDIYDVAREEARRRGLPEERVVSLLDARLRARGAG